MGKDRITVTIDAELLAWIDRQCETSGQARSAFIEEVLAEAEAETSALEHPTAKNLLAAWSARGVIEALGNELGLDEQQVAAISKRLGRVQTAAQRRRNKL